MCTTPLPRDSTQSVYLFLQLLGPHPHQQNPLCPLNQVCVTVCAVASFPCRLFPKLGGCLHGNEACVSSALCLLVLRLFDGLHWTLSCACLSLSPSGSQVLTTPAPTTPAPTTHNTTDLPSAEPTAMSNCVEVGDISFHSAPPPPLSTLPTPSGPPVPLREGAQSSPAGQPSMSECASFCTRTMHVTHPTGCMCVHHAAHAFNPFTAMEVGTYL